MIENINKYDRPTLTPIITLAEAQTYLKNIDVALTSVITSFINSVTNTFTDYLSSGLSACSYTGVYDYNINIYTGNYPILEVDKIYYRTTSNDNWVEYTPDSSCIVDDYSISFNNYPYSYYVLPVVCYDKSIKVLYKAGWETIPEPIKTEAKKLVNYLFKKSPHGNNSDNLNSLNIGTGGFSQSTTYTSNPEKSWQSVLDNYKRPII